MFRIPRSLRWSVLAVVATLALLTACHEADVLNPAQDPHLAGGVTNPGVMLTADPAEIVIDTTDPDAPTDPDSGLRIGSAALTAMVTDPDGNPVEGVEVVFSTEYGTLESMGDPVVTDAEGQAMDTLTVDEEAPASITVQAISGELFGSTKVAVTLILPNQPPVADAGEPQTAECSSPMGTPVWLDGSASSDPDSTEGTHDDIVEFAWFEFYGAPEETMLGTGEMLQVALGLGEHTITLRVTDSEGETATAETTVTIQDTMPPQVTVSLDPAMIWPPNHHWVDVHATLDIVEACTAPEDLIIELASVTSSEPDNANGDGNTEPDIMGADTGTEDYDFRLRAERGGPGEGRVYTAVYMVGDGINPEQWAEGHAVVPHDRARH